MPANRETGQAANSPRGDGRETPIRTNPADAEWAASEHLPADGGLSLERLAVRLERELLVAQIDPMPAHEIVAVRGGVDCQLSAEAAALTDAGLATWRAQAGFVIELRPTRPPSQADIDRQLHVLGYLMALPENLDWAVQLRVMSLPDPVSDGRGGQEPSAVRALALTLLCAASGESAAQAQRRLRQVTQAVALAGDFLRPPYELVPIDDLDLLTAVIELFPTADLVEIGPQRDLDLPAPAFGSIPTPLPSHSGLGHWLCHALSTEAARTNQRLGWVVTLESAPDIRATRLALGEELARAQVEQQRLLSTASLSEPVAAEGALEQAYDLGASAAILERMRYSLTGLSGRVQAFLVADDEVPASVIAAARAECSGSGAAEAGGAPAGWWRALRTREQIAARRAVQGSRCVAWEATVAARPGGGSGLVGGGLVGSGVKGSGLGEGARTGPLPSVLGPTARLADVRQVAALFRLPVPGPRGLPGWPVSESRQVWLAAGTAVRDSGALVLGDNIEGGGRQPVTLSAEDRRRHTYVVGQTGTGKSTLLLNCIVQDIEAGRGVGVLDPHGELIEQILAAIPEERIADVVLVDPSDQERPVGFNYIEAASDDERYQVAESFIGLMYQLFDPHRQGIVGPRFEHAARNAMLTAMSAPGMTLVEVVRILTDPSFVRKILPSVTDPLVRRYWTDQIAQTSDFHKSEVLDWIVSKFSPFVHNRILRNIIGQSRSTFSVREVMDERKILLVNLAQGRLGQKLSSFLGMILVPRLLLAALSRVDLPAEDRRDFYLYVDEFQQYATPAFVDIISGARKYGLSLTMAHQHVGQLPDDVRMSVFGNVGTLLALRVGVHDASLLAEAMRPSALRASDYIELPNFQAIGQVLADGRRSPCFTLATRPSIVAVGPDAERGRRHAARVRASARARHGRQREHVEAEIAQRAGL